MKFFFYLYRLFSYIAIVPYRAMTILLGPRYRWQTEVKPTLYLGGFYFFPWDYDILEKERIGIMVNLCREFWPNANRLKKMNVAYYHFPTTDKAPVRTQDYEAILAIVKAHPETKIIVNCAMGQSRSASVVWKLLIDHWGYSPDEAEKYLKDVRLIQFTTSQRAALESV